MVQKLNQIRITPMYSYDDLRLISFFVIQQNYIAWDAICIFLGGKIWVIKDNHQEPFLPKLR